MPELSEVALKVLRSRYFRKDENGDPIEDWSGLCERVARAVAQAEIPNNGDPNKCFYAFADMMRNLEFLPNSPTLMNAGMDGGQLSACFVLGVDDDISSIFGTVKDMATIFKSGGGVGLPMGRLRSKGSPVKSTGGVSSGPVSFMRVFNTTAEVVAQGGKRRGALMGTLPVNHPDIMEFIRIKQDLKELTSFNLSVTVTDAFMDAVKRDGEFNLVDPHTKSMLAVQAREIWDAIVECAWRTGEPGLIFIDRVNEYHSEHVIAGDDNMIEGTNPCSEGLLRTYESCNLGSINLAQMVNDDWSGIDVEKLERVTRWAVRFLDDVIDVNCYPLEKIRDRTLETRKIGLGVMGYADMLAKLGVAYGSEHGNDVLRSVLHTVRKTAIESSIQLAKERGTYPAAPPHSTRRNGNVLAIAPTGSLSMIAGCNGGIEPFFNVAVWRHSTLDGEPFVQVNQTFVEVLRKNGYPQSQIDEIAQRVADGADIRQEVRPEPADAFVCAHQVPLLTHVKVLSVAQSFVDQGCSKTCNAPAEATQDDIGIVFRTAYEQGCKSISVYRDGCRAEQPMSTKKARVVEREPDGSETGVGEASIPIEDVKRLMEEVRENSAPKDPLTPSVGGAKTSISSTEIDKWMETIRKSNKIPPTTKAEFLVVDERVLHGNLVKTVKEIAERIIQGDDKVLRGDLARALREAGLPIAGPADVEPHGGHLKPKDRPDILPGSTVKMKTGCGTLFVTVSTDEAGHPIELFAHHGKAGVCSQAQCEAIGRLCSASLRAGVDAKELAMQLRGITCHEQAGFGPKRVTSCADGVGKAILMALEDGQSEEPAVTIEQEGKPMHYGSCPQCGSATIREGGCVVCKACGWDKCS